MNAVQKKIGDETSSPSRTASTFQPSGYGGSDMNRARASQYGNQSMKTPPKETSPLVMGKGEEVETMPLFLSDTYKQIYDKSVSKMDEADKTLD